MSIELIQSALDLLRDNCPVITVKDDFESLFISDVHLGVKDKADDFYRAGHEDLLLDVVHRCRKVCIGGDFVDQWENPNIKEIWKKYPKIYDWYRDNPDIEEIPGNHNPNKKLPYAYRFVYPDGKYIFWTHGHKGDWACDTGSWLGRAFVRYIWAGIGQRVFGMGDPSTAREEGNPTKHLEVRTAVNEWVNKQDENMLGTIWGHTHFQERERRSFNDGDWLGLYPQGILVKDRNIILKTFT